MRISRRASGLAESATMRVSRKALELRAAGRTIVDLSAGQPDFPSPPVAVRAVEQALAAGHTRYTASAGIPELRKALVERYADTYGAPWQMPSCSVTVGAKAALFELMQIVLDDGDEAILPSPAWVSFEEQIRFAGAQPITVPMSIDDAFAIRAEPLIEAITDRTRLVLINSPCNPTGGIISKDELRRLALACAERDVLLVCDETYERFLYDGAEHASGAALASELPDTIIVISSFSKTYSMTGWRLGWAVGPRPIIDKLIQLQSHATSNPTTFAMYGALAAMREAESDVVAMLEAFAERRRFVVDAFADMPGVQCPPPAGAFYAFPRIADLYGHAFDGSLAVAEHLLEHAGVAVVPGLAFGDDDHIRLSIACSLDDLKSGLAALRDVLSSAVVT